MLTYRSDEASSYPVSDLVSALGDELKSDGIEVRLVMGDSDFNSPTIEAWYRSRPGHVVKIRCDVGARSPETVDCLATAIREDLHVASQGLIGHYTWDHTGTLWPD
jgi:hypothetical protein